jgi:hypothetical protein
MTSYFHLTNRALVSENDVDINFALLKIYYAHLLVKTNLITEIC